MLAFSRITIEKRNLILLRVRLQSALEPPCHPFHMRTVQALIRTHQGTPPATKTTRALRKFKVRVDYDSVHTVVAALQQFLMVACEVVGFHVPFLMNCDPNFQVSKWTMLNTRTGEADG